MKVKESVYLGRFLSQDGRWVGEFLTKIFVDFAVLIPAIIAASGKEMYFPRMGLWLDVTYLLGMVSLTIRQLELNVFSFPMYNGTMKYLWPLLKSKDTDSSGNSMHINLLREQIPCLFIPS